MRHGLRLGIEEQGALRLKGAMASDIQRMDDPAGHALPRWIPQFQPATVAASTDVAAFGRLISLSTSVLLDLRGVQWPRTPKPLSLQI